MVVRCVVTNVHVTIPRRFATKSFNVTLTPFTTPSRNPTNLDIRAHDRVHRTSNCHRLSRFSFTSTSTSYHFNHSSRNCLLAVAPHSNYTTTHFHGTFNTPLIAASIALQRGPTLFHFKL